MRWALLLVVFAGPAVAQIRMVELHGPARDFGYFAGDLFQSCATIDVGPGTTLDTRSLPPPGPVSASIDVRQVMVSDESAPAGRRVKVCVTYQNFLSPSDVTRVDIPGYGLIFSRAGERLAARVPRFSIAVSPFRHDLTPVLDPAALRADHPMLPETTWRPRRDLALGACLVALAGLLLTSDRILAHLVRRPAPFAEAARTVATLGQHDDAARTAFFAVHRAFDATAGGRMLAQDIGAFLERRPVFAQYRGEIETFFDASHAMFFGEPATSKLTPHAAAALCRKLARAERRS